jgi:hypothetical protein
VTAASAAAGLCAVVEADGAVAMLQFDIAGIATYFDA